MKAHNFKFETGIEVKDVITGFTGVIMVRAEYITGCDRYGVLSKKLNKDGIPDNYVWFDETHLIVIKKKRIVLDVEQATIKPQKIRTGGPRPNAPKR